MIIGLNGRKGAGKDTAGSYLVENYDFTRLSFADLLKESAAACFGIDAGLWDTWKNMDNMKVQIVREEWAGVVKIKDITARQFLQLYGTEAHREVFDQDFWVDSLFARADLDLDNENYVITDARFINEITAIKNFGGVIWRVEREGQKQVADNHQSEAEPPIELIDAVLENYEGVPYKMFKQIDALLDGPDA